MSQTLLDFRRSGFLNSLLFVRALSVEAVSVLSVIGLVGLKPAHATNQAHIPVPEPQTVENNQTSSFSTANNQTSPITPGTAVAATTNPAQQKIPAVRSREPIQRTEDELIQQMSGKATVAPADRTAAHPVFAPPSKARIAHRGFTAADLQRQPDLESARPVPPGNAGESANRGTLGTAKTNPDAGLGLLAPRQNSNQLQPTAQTESPSTPDTITQPAPPPAQGGPPVTDPRGNPLEESPRVEPPSSVPSERIPTQRSRALNAPVVQLQGVLLNQGDQTAARGRVAAVYPLTPYLLAGATVDLTRGTTFADSRTEGLNINELYLAASIPDLPNLRFVVGKLDLTSYFDRNSFAKDAATHFFNPVFQTNPALSVTGISSRIGGLVNWSITDNIEAKAAIFSSGRSLGNFGVDGFAGEVGIRYGNAIIRGTYVSDRDAGVRDGFREIYGQPRGNNQFGPLSSDREESYGLNGEVYIPNLRLGIFGRYGHYENTALSLGGDTYSFGLNVLDVFTPYDRLGFAYGRELSNNKLRLEAGDRRPDVMELFYDFRLLPYLRLGFTFQERNNFSETILGVRVKTEIDVTPRERLR